MISYNSSAGDRVPRRDVCDNMPILNDLNDLYMEPASEYFMCFKNTFSCILGGVFYFSFCDYCTLYTNT